MRTRQKYAIGLDSDRQPYGLLRHFQWLFGVGEPSSLPQSWIARQGTSWSPSCPIQQSTYYYKGPQGLSAITIGGVKEPHGLLPPLVRKQCHQRTSWSLFAHQYTQSVAAHGLIGSCHKLSSWIMRGSLLSLCLFPPIPSMHMTNVILRKYPLLLLIIVFYPLTVYLPKVDISCRLTRTYVDSHSTSS